MLPPISKAIITPPIPPPIKPCFRVSLKFLRLNLFLPVLLNGIDPSLASAVWALSTCVLLKALVAFCSELNRSCETVDGVAGVDEDIELDEPNGLDAFVQSSPTGLVPIAFGGLLIALEELVACGGCCSDPRFMLDVGRDSLGISDLIAPVPYLPWVRPVGVDFLGLALIAPGFSASSIYLNYSRVGWVCARGGVRDNMVAVCCQNLYSRIRVN